MQLHRSRYRAPGPEWPPSQITFESRDILKDIRVLHQGELPKLLELRL